MATLAKFTALQFSQALTRLASVPSKIAPTVAKEISADIQSNFDNGVDAYKRAWRPLAPATIARGRYAPPLTDSRDGRRSIRVFASAGAGVRITVGVGYMGVHQNGHGNHPPRRSFLPTGTLPKAWNVAWQKALSEAVRKELSK